ncbi:MAG TPA: glycerophosphodiester phosphodiesterase [Verrucomicrobiae bacterium]|nr:glycerophosphodiester phosphodiesterase [Verrucomicrobiae bacterium]
MAAAGFTVLAHRGARGHAPENTLRAFDKALELGAPWVELDVQWHAGELWVFHDARLERCTNGSGWLVDTDPATLRQLNAGGGERIPLLPEVLERIDRRCGVNVELKTGAGTGAAAAEVLRAFLSRGWKPEQFLVSSFLLPELREFKSRLPKVPLGVLLCGVPLDLAAAATTLGASVVSLDMEFAEPAIIADAHRRGARVFAYTVNASDDVLRMKALGVDGVFSDYPERALQLV